MSRREKNRKLRTALTAGNVEDAMRHADKKNIRLTSKNGTTALMLAIADNNIEASICFLNLNADPAPCFSIWEKTQNKKLDVLVALVRATCIADGVANIKKNDELSEILGKLFKTLLEGNAKEEIVLKLLNYFSSHFSKIWSHQVHIKFENKDTISQVLDKFRDALCDKKLPKTDRNNIASYVRQYSETDQSPGKQKKEVNTTSQYPVAFNGSRLFKNLRRTIGNDNNLHPEARAAACLIGTPSSPFKDADQKLGLHEFPHKDNETYHRSRFNPFYKKFREKRARRPKHTIQKSVDDLNKINGTDMAHLGLYNNSIGVVKDTYEAYKALTLGDHAIQDKKMHRKNYKRFLMHKRITCEEVVTSCQTNTLKVGFYHNYPCIMVHVPKLVAHPPHSDGMHFAWVQFMMSYFVGVLNVLASKAGFTLRITRRASFGFLTPHVADAHASFRIDPGIVPCEYRKLIVKALNITDKAVRAYNNSEYQALLKSKNPLPKSHFLNKEPYKKYKVKNIPDVENYVDFAWAHTEKSGGGRGKTSIQNLVRTSVARQSLSSYVEYLLTKNNKLSYRDVFANTFIWGMKQVGFSTYGKKIISNCKEIPLVEKIKSEPKLIEDQRLWKFISYFLRGFRAWSENISLTSHCAVNVNNLIKSFEKVIKTKNITPIHRLLVEANELLYAETLVSYQGETEDDVYGSDSECEADVDDCTIYAKKVIVANGTRAILDALLASCEYLRKKHRSQSCEINIYSHRAYYEIPMALTRIANIKKKRSYDQNVEILSMDMNPCITMGEAGDKVINTPIKPGVKILVLDNTSATEEECSEWIQKLSQVESLDAIIFASSGFKHEQLGADRNHYGTVRVFAKSPDVLSFLYRSVLEQDSAIRSGVSHAYRRTLKTLGCSPRNRYILMPEVKRPTRAEINSALRSQVDDALSQFIGLMSVESAPKPGVGLSPG